MEISLSIKYQQFSEGLSLRGVPRNFFRWGVGLRILPREYLVGSLTKSTATATTQREYPKVNVSFSIIKRRSYQSIFSSVCLQYN